MKFLDWYAKIAIGSALVGAIHDQDGLLFCANNKVTVLESKKRAWESSPAARAMNDALNPWRKLDSDARKNS